MHSLDLAMFQKSIVELECLKRPVSIARLTPQFFLGSEPKKRPKKTVHFLKREIGTLVCSIGNEGT